MNPSRTLTWLQIAHLGLVQPALAAIVVLTTSTFNRLMGVELPLPAVLPGALVAPHHGVRLSRPVWGLSSDAGGRRKPVIVGGMAILGLGALLAAAGARVLEASFWPGLALSALAYAAFGLRVGASGTSLLALLATPTAPARHPAAATVTWLMMMILGIALTAGFAGAALDPYGHAALMQVTTSICAGAPALAVLATWDVERRVAAGPAIGRGMAPDPFPMREGWPNSGARPARAPSRSSWLFG